MEIQRPVRSNVQTTGSQRRGHGTQGDRVRICTNNFRIMKLPDNTWYQYQVDISSDDLGAKKKREIVDQVHLLVAAQLFTPRGLYDADYGFFIAKDLGPSLHYTDVWSYPMGRPTRMPTNVTFTRVGQVRSGSLTPFIQRTANVSNEGLSMTKILNLILQQSAAMRAGNVGNRNTVFSLDTRDKRDLGGHLQLLRAFNSSVRPGPGYMFANVDISVGIVIKPGPVLELCVAFLRSAGDFRGDVSALANLPAPQFKALKGFLKGIRVMPDHRNKDYRQGARSPARAITALDERNAFAWTFDKNGETMSVAEYFVRRYNKHLQYPRLPLLRVGEAGWPMELCEVVPGQLLPKTKNLTPGQIQMVLDFTKKRPEERLRLIKESLRSQGVLDYENSPYLRQAGMEVNIEPITTTARVLHPPAILYSDAARLLRPSKGAWNMLQQQYRIPQPLQVWGVVIFEPPHRFSDRAAAMFIEELTKVCRARGMVVDTSGMEVQRGNPFRVPETLNALGSVIHANWTRSGRPSRPPDLILCILPFPATHIKTAIKRWGDFARGVATQVVASNKIKPEGLNQYCNNLALKINAKLGGVNCAPADNAIKFIQRGRTIIMGADVSHPAPGSSTPSTAALVTSLDIRCSAYAGQCRVQASRQETIEELEEMVFGAIEQYIDYGRLNKDVAPPKQLVFYRDGISEGQFADILEHELKAIRNGLIRQKINPIPKITYIVVGKMHHFRMFPLDSGSADRTGNCSSGTVVDVDVVNPYWNDFYLLSQQGLLGTSRPAHYSVLVDENNLSADELQQISFSLCHYYARATRTVSVPSVVYYADLVCARWHYHYESDSDFEVDSSGNGQPLALEYYKEKFKKNVHPNHRLRMYWM